ncbi:MAG: hypothetical protein R3E88_00590 [Myxococcota bacterium]
MGTASDAEPWIEIAPAESARGEAEQVDALFARAARAARAAAGGLPRLWIAPALGSAHAPREALRIATGVLAREPGLRVVAADVAAPDGEGAAWLRLAEDVATADAIAGGRLELAFRSLPRDGASLVARLRAAWAGEPVAAREGESGAEVEVHPAPARRGGPPLWLRCASAREVASAHAAGIGAVVDDARVAPPGERVALVRREVLR